MAGDINNMKQNDPNLVVDDLSSYVDGEIVKEVLYMRGVNKWLYVRKLVISLVHRWKRRIDELEQEALSFKMLNKHRKYHRTMGRRAELIEARQQLRALCHSPRDVSWDGLHRRDIKLPFNYPQRPHKRWFWRHRQVRGKKNENKQPCSTWRGVPLCDLTKEELIEVIESMGEQMENMRKEHVGDLDFLLG